MIHACSKVYCLPKVQYGPRSSQPLFFLKIRIRLLGWVTAATSLILLDQTQIVRIRLFITTQRRLRNYKSAEIWYRDDQMEDEERPIKWAPLKLSLPRSTNVRFWEACQTYRNNTRLHIVYLRVNLMPCQMYKGAPLYQYGRLWDKIKN